MSFRIFLSVSTNTKYKNPIPTTQSKIQFHEESKMFRIYNIQIYKTQTEQGALILVTHCGFKQEILN